MNVPLPVLAIGLPLLTAILLGAVPDPKRARLLGTTAALGSLALALWALARFVPAGPHVQLGGALPLFDGRLALVVGVDGAAVALLLLTAIVTLATLVASPRLALGRGGVVAVLATAAATVTVICARDLVLLGVGWLATLVPGAFLARRRQLDGETRRAHIALNVGGSLPLIAGIVLLAVLLARAGAAQPLSLDPGPASRLPLMWQVGVFVLLVLAALVRASVVPFHAWLPALAARGPLGPLVVLAGVPLSFVLLARVVVPLLPAASAHGLPIVAWIGLGSSVLGALLAVVQADLRRVVGNIVVSQSGLALVGLASLDTQGVTGSLLQSITCGLATTGLILVAWSLTARTGTADVSRLGGIVRESPRLVAVWFLLGFASVGFPGTLGFVGEDLLVQGILGEHPVFAALLLLATALNAIAFLRSFHRAFLGPRSRGEMFVAEGAVPDLYPRERATAFALVVLVVLGGLMPQPLLDLTRSSVEAVAHVSAPH